MKFKVLYKDLVVLELEMCVGARFRKEINKSSFYFSPLAIIVVEIHKSQLSTKIKTIVAQVNE